MTMAAGLVTGGLSGANAGDHDNIGEAQDFATGLPENPFETWVFSAGGRMFDIWWIAQDVAEPEATPAAYPGAGNKSGSTTWRCKECHGWDFLRRGRNLF